MSPVTVFFRTLLQSSAIFIGTAAIFLHPSLEWRGGAADRTTVRAQQGAHDAAVRGLIAALKDADQGVRVRAIDALGEIGDTRALDALTRALKDEDVVIRRHSASAIAQLNGGGGHGHPAPHPQPHPHPNPHPNPHPRPAVSELKDTDAGVRRQAAWALGAIGS